MVQGADHSRVEVSGLVLVLTHILLVAVWHLGEKYYFMGLITLFVDTDYLFYPLVKIELYKKI